jgi:hypothetical protein
MGHLAEINDVVVQDAVDLFEAQIELLVLNLLDADHNAAIAQITTARDRAADRILSLARGCSPTSEDAKVIRIAVAMLTKTYKRLIDTVEHRRAVVEQTGSKGQLHS